MEEKDRVFQAVLGDFVKLIAATAESFTVEVMSLSTDKITKRDMTTLQKFHDLYFDQSSSSKEVNHEVDNLLEQAMAAQESGDKIELQVDAAAEEKRLGLSAVQKEIETLISVEDGFREKVAPILASMQFEDAVRQRLEHIQKGWGEIFSKNFVEDQIDIELLKGMLSSVEETEDFYTLVLNEKPPEVEGGMDAGVLLF